MTTRQLLPVWLLATVGLIAGLVFGFLQPATYRAEGLVSLDSALQLPHYDAAPAAASFNDLLGLQSTQALAAEQSSLSGDSLQGVFSTRVPDSPLVRVTQQSSDRQESELALKAMTTAALFAHIEAEMAAVDVALTVAEANFAQATADLAPLIQQAGQGDADLEDIVRRNTFNLASAKSQLRQTEDSYWLTRLPGDIEAYEAILNDVEPVVEPWRVAKQAVDEATSEVEPLRERRLELERALVVVESQTAITEIDVSQVPASQTVGRFGAAGAVLGALCGAVVTLVLARSRSRSA